MKNKTLQSILHNRNLVIGGLIVLLIVLVAVFADTIAPYGFNDAYVGPKLTAPGGEFLCGTDDFGRDVFSRVIYGSRIALKVSLLATAIELALGVAAGLIAGYYGGTIDRVLSFIMDLLWSVPATVLAMAVVVILGNGIYNVAIAISVVSWPQTARTVRAKTQSLRNRAFIETAVAFNESDFSIMFRYILPNIVPVIVVFASLSIPLTITSTTALSFLGLGAMAPSPDWGLALSTSISFIYKAPWLAIFPGIALVIMVLGFNMLGEGLRDLLDPRNQSR